MNAARALIIIIVIICTLPIYKFIFISKQLIITVDYYGNV